MSAGILDPNQTLDVWSAREISKLVHQAEDGEEVVVRRGRKPVARIVAITADEGAIRRVPGRMRGRISMREDFDEWPPDVARALGISD